MEEKVSDKKRRCCRCQRVIAPIFSTGIAMKREVHCPACGYKWSEGRTEKARKRWNKEIGNQ